MADEDERRRIINVVGPAGLEPATRYLRSGCSDLSTFDRDHQRI